MCDDDPDAAKRPLQEIEDDIAKIKAEIDEQYYLLGKTVCETVDKDAGKIGDLVDRLVELKKERKAQNADRRDDHEHQ